MSNVLIPVDGSDVSLRAIQFMIEQIKHGRLSGLVVLNVQAPIVSGEIKRFVSQSTIEAYHRDAGEKALAQARVLLDAADVPYESHVEIGPVAETIVRFAQDKHCHSIVMGSRGQGSVVGLLLGSTTTKVLHLATTPVTIVK